VDQPEPGEMLANVIFNDLYPDFAREARKPKPGEDPRVTASAKAAFEHLQQGTGDESLFGASLDEKMRTALGKQMAGQFASYGASTAFVFKGQRSDGGKQWSDYLIEFGPGSTFKFSIALDNERKVTSLEFDGF
jgi:D-alanyl-D-alanine carboxypeptidase